MNYKLNHSLAICICAFISCLIPSGICASVEVDGIYYDLNTSAKTAAVAPNPDFYTGAVIIPSTFDYNGVTYKVTSIGSTAFLDCEGMIAINMPSSVTTIAPSAFERCTGLTNLEIGSGVTTINYEAFKNCINLSRLMLPSSLKTIGNESFAGCSSLNEIIAERTTAPTISSSTFTGVDKSTCIVYVPEGYQSAYANASYWKTFNNIVERIVLATGSCGDNVTYTLFSDMTMVISGTGEMWEYADIYNDYYQSVQHVIIEDGVSSIGSSSFESYISLTTVTIPNSVTSIGDYAFYNCTGLTSVSIPNSVTNVGYRALDSTFWFDDQPEGLVYAGKVAYQYKGDPVGEEIFLKDGTLGISGSIFYSCSTPASLFIPSSVVYIQTGCYNINDECSLTGLESIRIDPNNPIYDSRDNCNAIIETSTNKLLVGSKNSFIPYGVNTIGEFALGDLVTVTIPSSVTTIEEWAFCRGCEMIDWAGKDIFLGTSSLESIFVEGQTPPKATYGGKYSRLSSFGGVNTSTCILYVPIGCEAVYKEAEGWKEFQNIIEFEPDTDISILDNAIYVDQTEGRIGGTIDIPVKIKNSYAVRGFQFTMELPEGATINSWALSTNRLPSGATLSDKIATQKIEGNKISVACSLNYGDATFTGNDGEIATVNVTFSEDMEVGSYPIYLTACDVTTASGTDEDLSDVTATLVLEDYLVGDANGDGKIRIGDATTILNYIVGTTSDNFNEKAADANGDGKIRIGDATTILNIIVNQ